MKHNATKLLSSNNPKVIVRFPSRTEYKLSSAKKKTSPEDDEVGWISKKTKPSSSKKKSNSEKKKSTNGKSRGRNSTGSKAKNKSVAENDSLHHEVIDISDDSDSDDQSISRKRPSRQSAARKSKKIRSSNETKGLSYDSESSSEWEF